MNYKTNPGVEFLNRISKEGIDYITKSAYLFYGDEQYYLNLAVSWMEDKLILFPELNKSIFFGGDTDVETIYNLSITPPLMGEKRLMVVKDFNVMVEKKIDDDDFLNKMKSIPDTACVIFTVLGNIDKRRKVYKFFTENSASVEFSYLSESDKKRFIKSYMEKNDRFIDNDSLEYLINSTPRDLYGVKSELDKIIIFSHGKSKLKLNDISEIAVRTISDDAFILIKQISERRHKDAMDTVADLFVLGNQPLNIIGLILWQYKTIYFTKKYMGYKTDDEIGRIISTSKYAVRKSRDLAKVLSFEQIERAIEACLDTDYKIKTGSIKDRLGLEVLISKIISDKVLSHI